MSKLQFVLKLVCYIVSFIILIGIIDKSLSFINYPNSVGLVGGFIILIIAAALMIIIGRMFVISVLKLLKQ